MKKAVLLTLLALSALFASCFKPQAPYTYLTNDMTSQIYPKLKPGTHIKNVYVEDYKEVIPNYKGWLPALVVKVNSKQASQCQALGYQLLKGCDGSLYCVYPAPNAPVYVYVGNYTELLYQLNVTKGLGNETARLWIVELLDPFCPYCALFYSKGGASVIQQLVEQGKAYLIPIVVAFHKSAPGYEESLRLAYEQNELVKEGKTKEFFALEHEIVKNLKQLYEGKTRLSKTNVTKEELSKANERMLKLAQKLFPYVATPGNVFVDRPTGKAIAVMGALRPQGVMTIIDLLYGAKGLTPK